MSIVIQKRGVLDTVQDLGRRGYAKYGINPNGAMDSSAVRLINTLLGNDENEAVIEMHFPAPIVRFTESVWIAIGGADFCAHIGEESIETWKSYFAKKGSILTFRKKKLGARCYLSVRGGFQIDRWLESASTNLKAGLGGFNGRYLISTDKIALRRDVDSSDQYKTLKVARSGLPDYSNTPTIRAIAGAEYRDITALSEQDFLRESYEISNSSDRMGFRLNGNALNLLDNTELVSNGVTFGTVQLLPSGQMIILMADHQTTGGYPKIGHVIKQDLPLLAQLNPGDRITFEIVSVKEAEEIELRFERDLRFLKMGLRFNSNK